MSLKNEIYEIIYPDFCYYVLEDAYLATFVNSFEQLKKLTLLQSSFLAKLFKADRGKIKKEALKFAKFHSSLKIDFLFIYEGIEYIEKKIKDEFSSLNDVDFNKIDLVFNILKSATGEIYIKDMIAQALESIVKQERVKNYGLIKEFEKFINGSDISFVPEYRCELDEYLNSLEFKIKSFKEDELRLKFEIAHNNIHKFAELFISFYKKGAFKEAAVILDDLIKTSYLMFTLLKDIELSWERNKQEKFVSFLMKSFNDEKGFLSVIIEPSLNKRVENFVKDLFLELKDEMSSFGNNFIFLDRERIFVYFSKESEFLFLESIEFFQKLLHKIASKYKQKYGTILQYPIFRIGYLDTLGVRLEEKTISKVLYLIRERLESVKVLEPVYIYDFSSEISQIVQRAKEELEIEQEVLHAIKNKSFSIFYQKIIDANTEKLYSVEILSRIKTNRYIPANRFIYIVENANLTLEMDLAVFSEIYTKLENIKKITDRFFINIFPTSLTSDEFVNLLKKVNTKAEKIGLEMVMELTEHTVIKNLEILNDLNVKIAFDDFGSGYTNFERIGKITAENDYAKILKVDGEIVKNIASKAYENIVKSISYFAKEASLGVVYEYVEDKKAYEKLKEIVNEFGINGYIQGFYFSKPTLLE